MSTLPLPSSTAHVAFDYALVDVFAEEPLEGNQLAIFTDARGLSDAEMQAIARETDRISTMEADIRERAFFNRRLKGERLMDRRQQEIQDWEVEQARLKGQAERLRFLQEAEKAADAEAAKRAAEAAAAQKGEQEKGGADNFDPAKGSPLGWLLTIVHRKAVDRVRSAEASTRRDTTYHQRNQPVEHDSTAEAATASLEAHRVRQALASLTAVQRQALELAYFGGYTHTEVATMLELPVGTAKTRIRDGLIRLRDTMGVAT